MTVLLVCVLVVASLGVSPVVLAAIDRAPGDAPVLAGVGCCRACGSRRRGVEAVPVLAWPAGRGVCGACGNRDAAEVPISLAHAALWAAAGIRFGPHLPLVVYLAFFSTVLVLSIVDLETCLLPNRITYPALVASSVAIVVVSLVSFDDPAAAVVDAAIGGVGWAAFLLALLGLFWLLTGREGLGLGDVKLAALLGLHVGWIHPVLVIPALFVAGLAGLLAGVAALVVRSGENRPYPFGPWLAVGAVVVILASAPLREAFGV